MGFAILGGRQGSVPEPMASPLAPSPTAIAVASPAPFRPAAVALDPNQPRSLIVRGWVARTSTAVGVMVSTRTGPAIARAPIDPTGKPRNGMVPFEIQFALPRAAIAQGERLYVIATNARGFPLPDGRWQAVLGAVVEMVVR